MEQRAYPPRTQSRTQAETESKKETAEDEEEMKVKIEIDAEQIDGVVKQWLQDLESSVYEGTLPIYSYDPKEEAREIKKDLKAIKRLLSWLEGV